MLGVHTEVIFYAVSANPVRREEQRRSLCASGCVRLGVLRLRSTALHRLLLEMPVQTGGWMSANSPFARAGLVPDDTTWGAYNPADLPDTCFPNIGNTELGTERTGKLRGFRVPDPPGTGRTFLMVHFAERYGSEGCISTPDPAAWQQFCSIMADLHAAHVPTIPLRICYCPL